MHEDDGSVIRGTFGEYERFLESAVYADFRERTAFLEKISVQEYDDVTTLEDIARIKGRREAIADLATFFEQTKEVLEATKPEENENG